jgi:hypothetical protein
MHPRGLKKQIGHLGDLGSAWPIHLQGLKTQIGNLAGLGFQLNQSKPLIATVRETDYGVVPHYPKHCRLYQALVSSHPPQTCRFRRY